MNFKKLHLVEENHSHDNTNVNSIATITRFVKKTKNTPNLDFIVDGCICFYRHIDSDANHIEVMTVPELNYYLTTSADPNEVFTWKLAGINTTPPIKRGDSHRLNSNLVREMVFATNGTWQIENLWGYSVVGMDRLFLVPIQFVDGPTKIQFQPSANVDATVNQATLMDKYLLHPSINRPTEGFSFFIGICDLGPKGAYMRTNNNVALNKMIVSQYSFETRPTITVHLYM